MAYYNIEPFGPEREDLRAGTIASPLLNIWLKKGSKKTKASDWIMRFGPAEPSGPQDPEKMKAFLKAFANRAEKRGKKNVHNSHPQRRPKRQD
jgi:hypothetical protein